MHFDDDGQLTHDTLRVFRQCMHFDDDGQFVDQI